MEGPQSGRTYTRLTYATYGIQRQSAGHSMRMVVLILRNKYQTATVGSDGTWNLAAASSNRSAFSETSFTNGWFGNSCVSLLRSAISCGLDRNSFLRTHLHHSSPSPFFDGRKVAATAYAAIVSSSAPWLIASSKSDFASVTSPRNNLVTPRAVSSFVEDKEGFASCSV